MRTSPIDYQAGVKRPHYHIHHLKRRSLAVGNIFNERLSAAPTSHGSASTERHGAEPRGCKENFDMYLKSYCDMTSLHGLRYFAESGRPWYERSFWLFAVFLVILGMVTTIYAQIVIYINNPILMTLNSKVTPVNDVPFPAITICSENQARKSLINVAKILENHAKRNTTVTELAYLEIVKLLCIDVNNEPVDLPINGTYLHGFHKYGLLYGIKSCQETFKRFNWQGNAIDPCTHLQVTTTLMGLCHTFNMIPPLSLYTEEFLNDFVGTQPISVMLQYRYEHANKRSSWSPDTGYVIDTNRNGYDVVLPYRIPTGSYVNSANFLLDFGVDDIQGQCVPRANGFLIIVHSPNELPSLEHTLMYAELDQRSVLHITPKLTNTDEALSSWPPEERGCYYNHERKLRFFAVYTGHNCNLECEANYTLKLCKCNVFFQPHFYATPLCTLDKYDCYHKSTDCLTPAKYLKALLSNPKNLLDDEIELAHSCLERPNNRRTFCKVFVLSSSDSGHRGALYSACNCLPACNEIKYDIQVTAQPRNWTYNTRMYGIPENETRRNNYASILALYRYKQVNSISRVAIVSDSDFIANIGGLMGLFLGFSFISVFEVLYFSSIRWMTDVHKRNKWYRKWNKAKCEGNKSICKGPVVATVTTSNDSDGHWHMPFVKTSRNPNGNHNDFSHPQWDLPFINHFGDFKVDTSRSRKDLIDTKQMKQLNVAYYE